MIINELMIQERLYCEMAGVCKYFIFNKTKLRKWLESLFFFSWNIQMDQIISAFRSKIPSEQYLQLSSSFNSLVTSRWHCCPVIVANFLASIDTFIQNLRSDLNIFSPVLFQKIVSVLLQDADFLRLQMF